ncbi:MAG TPA: clostripain-related cysteine peptidase, partial [Elusimicrobiales bacterium]|nr:clostripain-related cysteine peptidase [Elusimicrobiales bacterium]
MKLKLYGILALSLLSAAPASAKKAPEYFILPDGGYALPARPQVFPAAVDPGQKIVLPQPVREWTVMVYANGKNDLAPDIFADANEMEMAGSTPQVNVILELGQKGLRADPDFLEPAWKSPWRGIKRFFILKDTKNPDQLHSIPLPAEPYADMGSHRHLAHFGQWVKKNFPAKKYMLIVSNHGNGILGISYDDVSGNNIALSELGKAVSKIGGVDVFATDACLMQMAEVAYALKGLAETVVGSEETIPAEGYNYKAILKALGKNPGMDAEAASKMLVKSFDNSYKGSGEPVTLSALKMSEIDELSGKVKAWTEAVMSAPDAGRGLRQALRRTRSFEEPSFRDLHHFISLVARYSED